MSVHACVPVRVCVGGCLCGCFERIYKMYGGGGELLASMIIQHGMLSCDLVNGVLLHVRIIIEEPKSIVWRFCGLITVIR